MSPWQTAETGRAGVGHPLHDIHEVRALVGHVAAGVVPEAAPPAEVLGLEGTARRAALEEVPIEGAGERGVVERDGEVPVPHRLDHGDAPQRAFVDRLLGLAHERHAAPLHADLHDAVGRAGCFHHARALFQVQRERLLEVDVFAGGERVEQHRAVMVVRRGDHDEVEALVRQQVLVVHVGLRVFRRLGEGALAERLVDVADGDALRAELLKGVMQPAAAAAYADGAERGPVVGKQRRGGDALEENTPV